MYRREKFAICIEPFNTINYFRITVVKNFYLSYKFETINDSILVIIYMCNWYMVRKIGKIKS